VLTRDYPGLVLRLMDHSLQVGYEDEVCVHIRAGAGMAWHQLVEKTLALGWFGLENLALIPGTVGAAPVQNIGAYGVEIAAFILSVDCVNIASGERFIFDKAGCQFSYRNSIFKQQLLGKTVVTSVVFILSKKPQVNTQYAALHNYLSGYPHTEITPHTVKEAVCAIRRMRLPDPTITPNAGSFFKNPQIDAAHFAQLQKDNPAIAFYTGEQGRVKLAAAWLIEQSGWKGRCIGDACVHDQQALVLINRGHANGTEILALANSIAADVYTRFAVQLEYEPWVW
jgi:UDP-N-acetylmuramate dehydrogenase